MLDRADLGAPPLQMGVPRDVFTLAARGDALYFAVDDSVSGRIYRIRAGESEAQPLTDEEPGVRAIAVDDDYVYWTTGSGQGDVVRMCR